MSKNQREINRLWGIRMKTYKSKFSKSFKLFVLLLLRNCSRTTHGAFSNTSILGPSVLNRPTIASNHVHHALGVQKPRNEIPTHCRNRSAVILGYSKDKRPSVYEESERRGAVLLFLALLLCVWSFSIPVELRRDHWCFTSQCASNRSACYDCITFGEWFQKVQDYYATGGGIQFDFTVEDKNSGSVGEIPNV